MEEEAEEEDEEEMDPDETGDQDRDIPRPPAAAGFRGLDALLELMRQPFPPRPMPPVDQARETDDIAPWALDDDDEMQVGDARAPWALANNDGDNDDDYEDNGDIGWAPPVYGWAPVPVDLDAIFDGLQSDYDDDVGLDESIGEDEDREIGDIITASEGVPFPWGGGGRETGEPDDSRQDDDDDGVD